MENGTNRKFNIKNFLLFIMILVGAIIISMISNIIPWDPEGILIGFTFVGILIFLGFLLDKLGLGKFFGGN